MLYQVVTTTSASHVDCPCMHFREQFPEYFSSIRSPLTFQAIALKLTHALYGSLDTLPVQFYRDMRQVLLNCISYNTESSAIFAQAHKLLPVVYRHVDRWVFSREVPSVSFSYHIIPYHHAVSSYHMLRNFTHDKLNSDSRGFSLYGTVLSVLQ